MKKFEVNGGTWYQWWPEDEFIRYGYRDEFRESDEDFDWEE